MGQLALREESWSLWQFKLHYKDVSSVLTGASHKTLIKFSIKIPPRSAFLILTKGRLAWQQSLTGKAFLQKGPGHIIDTVRRYFKRRETEGLGELRTSLMLTSASTYCRPFWMMEMSAAGGTKAPLMLDWLMWLSMPNVNAEWEKPGRGKEAQRW